MSYHPYVPSLLGLSRWFCRDLRKKIYSYMSRCDIGVVKMTHGFASIHDYIYILRNTKRIDVFRMVAEMHMLDGMCTISQHANNIMNSAIGRNDLEFAKYVCGVMFCEIHLGILTSYEPEVFDWVLANATQRMPTSHKIAITPSMLAQLRAHGYEGDAVSSIGVGMGCALDDILACDNIPYAIIGVIKSARWDMLMTILEAAFVPGVAIPKLIRYAPDAIFDRFITSIPPRGHICAWKHSPERALRALMMDKDKKILVNCEKHARLTIAHGRVPIAFRAEPNTWQLDLGLHASDSWYTFDSVHYPRLHECVPLPQFIVHTMTLPQIKYLHANGVPFSKTFYISSAVTYEHAEFVLSCHKPEMEATITEQDPATVQLLYDHGWRPLGEYLNHVSRVDTFRWMIQKFGAYPEIYVSIDMLDPLLYEELYAVCEPPKNAMIWTKSIYIVQWLHKKGLVYEGKVDTPLREFMAKHFGEPWDCIPANK